MRFERFEVNHEFTGQEEYTPEEAWTLGRTPQYGRHFYYASADFAVNELGSGPGKCLVIGSPIFEALELEEAGWHVSYLDVRQPPKEIKNWIKGDACDMPLEANFFDAVSSTCVLCHVGLGRYGDDKRSDGDMLMMLGVYRVLKPGGIAALTIGPAADSGMVRCIGALHRVYTLISVIQMAEWAGLRVEKTVVWDAMQGRWRDEGEPMTKVIERPDYLSMLLRK